MAKVQFPDSEVTIEAAVQSSGVHIMLLIQGMIIMPEVNGNTWEINHIWWWKDVYVWNLKAIEISVWGLGFFLVSVVSFMYLKCVPFTL